MMMNILFNEKQYTDIGNAFINKKGITFQLNENQINVESGYPLNLTKSQINKFKNKNFSINLSFNQCKKIIIDLSKHIKTGGALPLLALIPLITKAAAILGGVGAAASVVSQVVNAVNNKKSQDKMLEETKRHNKSIENKFGSGLFLENPPKNGKSLFLKP